eukprot:g7821.t1
MSFSLEEERYQLTTVQRRGNVRQGESNEEAYDGKRQFKEWRRAVLLRLGEKSLERALKPVNEHYRMVHEDHVTALQSKGKDVPKYMWMWEELYGDGEKEKENEEEESVREVTRKETEVRSPLTMKQSTPSIADKRTSTRLKEAVERLRKASEAQEAIKDLQGYAESQSTIQVPTNTVIICHVGTVQFACRWSITDDWPAGPGRESDQCGTVLYSN